MRRGLRGRLRRGSRGQGRSRGQVGEALIESLIAIAILSSIVAATYGGMQVSLRASATNDDGANAGTLLRSAAETLQNPDVEYIELAGCGGKQAYTELPTREGFGEVTSTVGFWEPSSADGDDTEVKFSAPGDPEGCPKLDPGLQLIELSVITPLGTTETLQVTKRQP